MKLVVIESPGKRETLQKYLGKDYLVINNLEFIPNGISSMD